MAITTFVGVYALYGVFLQPEFLPLGLPLVPIFLLYAGLVVLTAHSLRQAGPLDLRTGDGPWTSAGSMRYLALYLLMFLGVFLGLGGLLYHPVDHPDDALRRLPVHPVEVPRDEPLSILRQMGIVLE